MTVLTERLAANSSLTPYGVNATNEARSSFAVTDRSHGLWLLDGESLEVLDRWRLGDDAVGTHAIHPLTRTALISGVDSVKLLDVRGKAVWKFSHPPWKQGGFDTGCAWFDDAGRAFAVVPSDGYDGCDVVHLNLGDGEALQRANLATAPAGLHAIHQAGGWVGLSVGEGQDGAYAWWVRVRDDRLDVIGAGWSDEVLFDSDAPGRHVLTTPHGHGPLKVRSFPELEIVREIQAPAGYWWDLYACFVDDYIVARVIADTDDTEEALVSIDADETTAMLGYSDDPISPGPRGSWITSAEGRIERWRLSG